jgi:hypothetical protein
LIEILGLQTQQAHTTIYGLDGNVMSHATDSRKTRLSVSYYEHEQPVDESEVLIVSMTVYDLVLGLPWFKARNPEIDWETGKLLSLQRRQPQPNNHGKEVLPTETGPDIQTLSATAFEDLCSSDEVSHTFSLTLGECNRLLRATTGGHPITMSYNYTPREQTRRAGAAAVVAAEEHTRDLNDCYWLAETMKRRKITGTGTSYVRRTEGSGYLGFLKFVALFS